MKVKGIARYAHLMKASAPTGTDNFKFSVQLLIHKSDAQCKQITDEIETVIKNGFPKGKPTEFRTCWSDLAVKEPDNEALKDYMCLSVGVKAENGKPPLVDQELKPIIDPAYQIEGKIVWINGNPATYEIGTPGVNTYLNGTMVTNQKGDIPLESISSKPSIEDMFGDVSDTSSNTESTTPSVPPTPNTPSAPSTNTPSAPTPNTPSAPSTKYEMTEKANGTPREEFIKIGWTDSQLIEQGYMLPPNGITPSFT